MLASGELGSLTLMQSLPKSRWTPSCNILKNMKMSFQLPFHLLRELCLKLVLDGTSLVVSD